MLKNKRKPTRNNVIFCVLVKTYWPALEIKFTRSEYYGWFEKLNKFRLFWNVKATILIDSAWIWTDIASDLNFFDVEPNQIGEIVYPTIARSICIFNWAARDVSSVIGVSSLFKVALILHPRLFMKLSDSPQEHWSNRLQGFVEDECEPVYITWSPVYYPISRKTSLVVQNQRYHRIISLISYQLRTVISKDFKFHTCLNELQRLELELR